jgi:hypothetical protein
MLPRAPRSKPCKAPATGCHAARRSASTCRSHTWSWFQLAKFRLTSFLTTLRHSVTFLTRRQKTVACPSGHQRIWILPMMYFFGTNPQ